MNALIMFAKAPTPGRVKTRLCPPLTLEQATALYAAFACDTLSALTLVPQAHIEIAYGGASATDSPSWLGPAASNWFALIGSDLGEHMISAFERAFSRGARRVIIVGSDAPDLDPKRVARAFAALEGRDVVLGPSEDGGYYLVGLSRPRVELFRSMTWSTPRVLEETLARVKKLGLSLEMLKPYRDIDTAQDLEALRARLRSSRAAAARTRLALSSLYREERRS